MLQNKGNILPLNPSGKTFAVLGDAGSVDPTIAGGGSGHVNAPYVVTPLAGLFLSILFNFMTNLLLSIGITTRVGSAGKVSYAQTNPITSAAEVAKAADYAIVFVGFTSSEGSDR